MNTYSIDKENLTIINFGEIYSIPYEESYWRYNKQKRIHPIPINYSGITTLSGKKYEFHIEEGPNYVIKDVETKIIFKGTSCQEAFSSIFKERKIKDVNPLNLIGFEQKEIKEKLNDMVKVKITGYLKRKLESLGCKEDLQQIKEQKRENEEEEILERNQETIVNETIEIEELKNQDDDDNIILNCSQDLAGYEEDNIEASRNDQTNNDIIHESNELSKAEKESDRSELIKFISEKKDVEKIELLSEQSNLNQLIILETPPLSPIVFPSPKKGNTSLNNTEEEKIYSNNLPEHPIETINRDNPLSLMQKIELPSNLINLTFSNQDSRLFLCLDDKVLVYELDFNKYVHTNTLDKKKNYEKVIFDEELYLITRDKKKYEITLYSEKYDILWEEKFNQNIIQIYSFDNTIIIVSENIIIQYQKKNLKRLREFSSFNNIRCCSIVPDSAFILVLESERISIFNFETFKIMNKINITSFKDPQNIIGVQIKNETIFCIFTYNEEVMKCGLFNISTTKDQIQLKSNYEKDKTDQFTQSIVEKISSVSHISNYLNICTRKGKNFIFAVRNGSMVAILVDASGELLNSSSFHQNSPIMAFGGKNVYVYYQKEKE